MNVLVDYLRATFKTLSLVEMVDRFGVGDAQWLEGRPRDGWTMHDYFNGVHLYHGGRVDIGIELSGSGCRTVESFNGCSFDWLKLFRWIYDFGDQANVSRLDVACDDREGVLNFETIVKYTKQGKYISKARKRHWTDGDERIVMFGSPSSDTRLRIYDKALERDVEGHWIRAEFQLRDKSADSFIYRLLEREDIGAVYGGTLLNYLRYTVRAPDPSSSHNYDSVKTACWWEKFVGTSEKIKNFYVGGVQYNLDSLYEYLSVQAGSSMRTYVEIFGASGLLDLVYECKPNEKQIQLLRSFNYVNC